MLHPDVCSDIFLHSVITREFWSDSTKVILPCRFIPRGEHSKEVLCRELLHLSECGQHPNIVQLKVRLQHLSPCIHLCLALQGFFQRCVAVCMQLRSAIPACFSPRTCQDSSRCRCRRGLDAKWSLTLHRQ